MKVLYIHLQLSKFVLRNVSDRADECICGFIQRRDRKTDRDWSFIISLIGSALFNELGKKQILKNPHSQ